MRKIFPILLWVFFCLCVQAKASIIPTLFNTGVDGSGTPLLDGTMGDPHYKLISVPDGTTDILVRTSAGGYPIPPYIGDDSLSAWIGPNNFFFDSSGIDGNTGTYLYRTTFDLSGFDLSTVKIKGGWTSDNAGTNIFINGVATGMTNSGAFSTGFDPFVISSGFLPGINTLDFQVFQDGFSPTALRVEFTNAVPEPSSLTLLGTMLVAVLGYHFKRRGSA